MSDCQRAQVNVARAAAPLDDPRLADFVALLDGVNQQAAPRMNAATDSGNAAVEAAVARRRIDPPLG